VRVAFLGGTPALHAEVADATKQITDACNLQFDFGLDPATGQYRSWSTEATEYAAEIRVSFDLPGYWSLVGTDSIDAAVGRPDEAAGGRPYQRSLNLLLTDGQRICFADFGLALSARFELSPDERAYLHEHANLDQAYALAKWVGWLVATFGPADAAVAERMATVQAIAHGQAVYQALPGVPDDAAAIIRRHAPVAALINAFYVRLHEGERDAPYPRRAVEAVLWRA
jgi:hypothetical protein